MIDALIRWSINNRVLVVVMAAALLAWGGYLVTTMPVDPLSRARLRLAMLRVELEWVPHVQAIQAGNKAQAEAGRKRLKELMLNALPLFKAARFFLNPEMSLADCAVAPIVYRLPALGIVLPKEAKLIEDYGQRIFRNPGFLRSMTPEEKMLREQLPA